MERFLEKVILKTIKKMGVFRYYDENGKLEKEIIFQDGDIII